MKINQVKNYNHTPKFKGTLNNKVLLSSLEKIADHGTTFVAGTTFVMSAAVRPLVISLTPKVDKENKKYAAANSIASGITKFALTEAIALPVEKALKNIDKNPSRFLCENSVLKLKGNATTLQNSQPYKVLNQFLKMSSGFITAIPKSMLTIALLPFVTDLLSAPKRNKTQKNPNSIQNTVKSTFDCTKVPNTEFPKVFSEFNGKISFKGNHQILTKNVAKIFNNKKIQDFVINHNFDETNIARNMSVATDILLTGSYALRTMSDKKINSDNKRPLIFGNLFSTAVSLSAGCFIDKLVQKNTKNFIKKFTLANQNDPKLHKYIQGINILRPTLIFAGIYYGLLPIASTYFGDKFDKFTKKSKTAT